MYSYEFCEIFKNTFFTEHLGTTAFEINSKEKIKPNLKMHSK